MTASSTTEQPAILLRYHEIALKGENRAWFENRLAINARKMLIQALGPDARIDVSRKQSRILIHAPWNEKTRQALQHVFGVASFSVARPVATSREELAKAALDEVEAYVARHGMPRSFRVSTKRTEKALPETSVDLDRSIGAALLESLPALKVDLENPELTVGVELRYGQSYVWTEKIRGQGGLPVGVNGSVLALISGGLDSPVAATKALRRGSPVSFVHFWGAPFVGEEALRKVEDLVRLVNRFQPDPRPLHVVPFGKLQERIALASNPKIRTLLYRRMMVRVACALASRIQANALITGESLGQVASQTVENISAIDAVSTLPVLRPLITYDKDEIIAEARRWGTYDKSIEPAADCCTLFADRHPAIRGDAAKLEAAEKAFSVAEMVEEALANVEVRETGFAAQERASDRMM